MWLRFWSINDHIDFVQVHFHIFASDDKCQKCRFDEIKFWFFNVDVQFVLL
jgi:hypothetical protein